MVLRRRDAVQEGELCTHWRRTRQRMTLQRQPVESCPFRASSRQTTKSAPPSPKYANSRTRLPSPPHRHQQAARTSAAPKHRAVRYRRCWCDGGLARPLASGDTDRCPCSSVATAPVRTVVDQHADESFLRHGPHDHQRRRRIGCRYRYQPLRCNALDDHSVAAARGRGVEPPGSGGTMRSSAWSSRMSISARPVQR